VKFAFVFVVVYLVNCQFVAASNSTASDKVAKSLHSELKYVESEIKRVWMTIQALEEEIHQNPESITDETNKGLYEFDLFRSRD
jgi:septal ring factor EnvC (AmiA/AmiB activator)